MKTKQIAKSMLFIAAINIFPAAIFMEGTSGTFEIKAKNDLTSMNLFGKVKSIEEVSYKSQGGNVTITDTYKEYSRQVLFNTAGNITGEFNYNANGSLNNRSTCIYNNKGLRTHYIRYDAGGMAYDSIRYEYDNKGNLVEENSFEDEAKYYYDNNGNRIGDNHYDPYDMNSIMGIPKIKITYKYDQKGNQIEKNRTEHDEDLGDTQDTWTYKYDDKGNIIEVKTSFILDSPRITYKYDLAGNVIEENHYQQNGMLDVKQSNTSVYVKDLQQNWTLRDTYQNNVHTQSVVRVITYY
jgi:hypothetical protein